MKVYRDDLWPHLKPDRSTLLKISARSAGSEFQIVKVAWQNEWVSSFLTAHQHIKGHTVP